MPKKVKPARFRIGSCANIHPQRVITGSVARDEIHLTTSS